jgi:flagellar basal-body rod protein FlgC
MPTLSDSLAASASALAAERTRIEAAISNLANAESTRGPDGGPYRRRAVVLAADPINTFDAALGRAGAVGVRVAGVVEDDSPFPQRYQPSHPDADASGFVSVPNVDPSEEVVDMMSAARAYQANLAAIGLVRDLVRQALDLAR